MLMSKPSPPKTGDNTFEVMVKDAAGKPVTDADVTAMFFMAAMPAMKMPEMKNTVTLKHQKDGTYSRNGPGDDGRQVGRDRHGQARRQGDRVEEVSRHRAVIA